MRWSHALTRLWASRSAPGDGVGGFSLDFTDEMSVITGNLNFR